MDIYFAEVKVDELDMPNEKMLTFKSSQGLINMHCIPNCGQNLIIYTLYKNESKQIKNRGINSVN